MNLFARLTKIDEATRRVYGIASSEDVDHANESMDYEGSKAYFTAWSGGVAKATGGQSVGNLRVMHGNVVAGKLIEMQCDDVAKAFPICAEVVDDNEWKKVQKGCYTGFSIGGKYVSKVKDPATGITKYVASPNEVSLVDLPCNPTATFTVSKADGTEELRKFEYTTDDEALRKWAGSLGDDARAALTKALTPAPVVADPREALAKRIHQNLAKAEPVARSIAVLLGKPLEKGMCDVAALADILNQLGWVADDAAWEASWEGDGSTVPADLRAAVKTLGSILVRMATEEAQELADALGTEKLTPTGDLHKGATSPEDSAMNEAMQKSLDTANTELAKAIGERDTLTKALGDAHTALAERDVLLTKAAEALDERNEIIKKFQNAPAPVRAALMAVTKGSDVNTDTDAELEKVLNRDGTVDEAGTAIRKALQNPVVVR